jgi:hypothetical protein
MVGLDIEPVGDVGVSVCPHLWHATNALSLSVWQAGQIIRSLSSMQALKHSAEPFSAQD